MVKTLELQAMKGIKELVMKFGAGVPQQEKDFLDGVISKLESGKPLDAKEQEYVDKNMKSINERR